MTTPSHGPPADALREQDREVLQFMLDELPDDETIFTHERGALRRALASLAPKPEAKPSREARMVTLERDANGVATVWCDPEIADIVSALNAAGLHTVASCSGHGHRPGNVVLADGRELVIARDHEEARAIDRLFPVDINGERVAKPEGADVPSKRGEAIEALRQYVDRALPEGADEPARYFVSGPALSFYADDKTTAEALLTVAGVDRDDWTITDLHALSRAPRQDDDYLAELEEANGRLRGDLAEAEARIAVMELGAPRHNGGAVADARMLAEEVMLVANEGTNVAPEWLADVARRIDALATEPRAPDNGGAVDRIKRHIDDLADRGRMGQRLYLDLCEILATEPRVEGQEDVQRREPAPNWCRSCGRRPNDPLAALTCRDSFHAPTTPPVGTETPP